jgi:hypothetical protein
VSLCHGQLAASREAVPGLDECSPPTECYANSRPDTAQDLPNVSIINFNICQVRYTIALFCSVVFFASCRYSPTEAGTGYPVSSLRGWISLEGKQDSLHIDHSGIKVEILETDLIAYTDALGYYEINDIPGGMYSVQMTAPGYDTAMIESLSIFAPSGAIANGYMLFKELRLSIRFDSTMALQGGMALFGTLNPILDPAPVVMFFGRTADVDATWERHELSQIKTFSQFAGGLATYVQYNQLGYQYVPRGKTGFRSGDSVYCVAYTGSGQVFDRVLNNYRWLNLRNKSNVIVFRIP